MHSFLSLILFMLLFSSCAHQSACPSGQDLMQVLVPLKSSPANNSTSSKSSKSGKKSEVEPEADEVTMATALNFGRVSFIRGCVTMGLEHKTQQSQRPPPGSIFSWCAQEAKKHWLEIKSLVENQDKK